MSALTSVYLLFDSGTGVQLAAIDGNTITLRRTVATSALAASFLARQNAERLLILGSGRVARLLSEAYRAVRAIKKLDVWNINPDSAHRMVRSLIDSGIEAALVSDLEQGVRSVDIVSAATLATAPLIRGEWLQPGTHVDLIGAFTPKMREADAESVQRSTVFVDTIDALHEAGDLVDPVRDGVFSADLLMGTLTDLCNGKACGRTSPDEITLFKAVGSALADLAAATMVYKTPLRSRQR
jgi:ornithine cyclodeaminase